MQKLQIRTRSIFLNRVRVHHQVNKSINNLIEQICLIFYVCKLSHHIRHRPLFHGQHILEYPYHRID